MEQHCRDPADCPFYPVHSCFASERGLICQHRSIGGFEMSINSPETFYYTPNPVDDDIDMPCVTIPHSDELISYVDYRGSDVIDVSDLALIGNCSKMSYCDAETKTCQRKHNIGSPCRFNMECFYEVPTNPGHCDNHTICVESVPYYSVGVNQWTMGDQWRSAAIAVVVTGLIVMSLLVGRQQARFVISGVQRLAYKWHNRSHMAHRDASTVPFIGVDDQQPSYRGRWWKRIPWFGWVYKRLHPSESQEIYSISSPHQQRQEDPPPYRD